MIIYQGKEYLDIRTIEKIFNDKYENIYKHLSKVIEPVKIGNMNFYEKEIVEDLFNRIIVFRNLNIRMSKKKRCNNE